MGNVVEKIEQVSWLSFQEDENGKKFVSDEEQMEATLEFYKLRDQAKRSKEFDD